MKITLPREDSPKDKEKATEKDFREKVSIMSQFFRNLHETSELNFANIVNNAPVEGLDITIGANEAKNIFRKDEIKRFEDTESLLQNAETKEQNMFKIPKVI